MVLSLLREARSNAAAMAGEREHPASQAMYRSVMSAGSPERNRNNSFACSEVNEFLSFGLLLS